MSALAVNVRKCARIHCIPYAWDVTFGQCRMCKPVLPTHPLQKPLPADVASDLINGGAVALAERLLAGGCQLVMLDFGGSCAWPPDGPWMEEAFRPGHCTPGL